MATLAWRKDLQLKHSCEISLELLYMKIWLQCVMGSLIYVWLSMRSFTTTVHYDQPAMLHRVSAT